MSIKFTTMMVIKAIGAIVALAVAFGAPVSEDQKQAILGVAGALLAIAAAQGLINQDAPVEEPPVDPTVDVGNFDDTTGLGAA